MESGASVLFVWTANIARSAFAEQLARSLVGDRLELASAGTHGLVDQPIDPPMADELRARGVEPDGFRSRPLTMAMVDGADLVLTTGMVHRQFILDDRPAAVWRTYTLGQFARTVAGVPDELHGADLIRACRDAHKPAQPGDDVVDPHGRGPAAAAAAAEHLERLLREVIPRLAPPRA